MIRDNYVNIEKQCKALALSYIKYAYKIELFLNSVQIVSSDNYKLCALHIL